MKLNCYSILSGLCLLFLIILIILHCKKENFIIFNLNNQDYKVNKFDDSKKAAEIFERINFNILRLLNHLDKKYLQNENYNNLIILNGIRKLKNKYHIDNVKENFPNKNETSYTIDKGKIIAICLRSLHEKKLHTINDITFVVIHELAHIFTSEFGHTKLFWKNFKFLLEESVEIKIYEPVNYKFNPSKYCGLTIKYSPLYDNTLL